MKKNITLLLFTLLLCCNVNAQDGTNDLTFNPNDTGYGNGVNDMITTVLPLVNGKVFIAGVFTAYKSESISRVGMLNADKSLDMSFVSGSGANDIVWVSALQADGKIIIGGDFTEYNGQIRNKIARINADGSLDTSFTIGTGAGSISAVKSIVLQADGKILVGGYFNSNDQTVIRLVRLNTDGSLDASFSVAEVAGSISALAVQADEKILVGGSFLQFNGSSKKRLVRLNSDGSTDTTFAVADGPNDSVECIAVNNQGKIFIGGRFTTFNQQSKRGIIGLNEDGSVNTSFNVGTGLLFGWVRAIVIKEDGKVIIGGDLSSYNGSETGAAIQINIDGTLDTEFQLGSAEFGAYSIKIGQEGKIFIAGRFKMYGGLVENHITCRNSNGSRNTLFDNGPGTGADNGIRSTVVQPDGKIIIGGSFNYYNGVLKNRIARLNVDGSNDNTFLTGLGFNSDVLLVLLQPDGKIIVSGYFTKYKGLPVDPVVRLNTDGSLDTSFNFNLPFEMENVYISRAVIQPDGKIILGEQFVESFDLPNPFINICRLKATGALDTNFNSQALERGVTGILLQPDGKIIVAYSNINLDDNIFIQRLNSNGSIDTSFAVLPVSTLNFCSNMVLQSDGKIVLSGGVYTDGVFTNKVLRINADGTLDSSFSEIVLGEKKIYKLWLQPDDKMLATGDFETFDGFPTKGFVRINQNGSVDTTFNCGEGANNGINSVSFQGSKIIISGLFTAYDNIGRNGISRINSTGFLDNDTFIESNNNIIVYKTNNSIVINSIKDIASVEVYDLMGRLIAQKRNIKDINTSLDEILASNTVLIVKVKHVDGTRVTKKIYY